MARGDEGDGPAVGRPARRMVFVVAVSDLDRLGRSVGRHDEQVLPPVRSPSHAVELVLQSREPPRLPLLVVFFFVGCIAHARHEGDARAVRRPDGLRDVLFEARELARLAPGHRHHEQLRRLVGAIGREREPRAVGRPARVAVGLVSAREPARRRGPIHRRHPDRGLVLVGVLVHGPDRIRHRRPVRREPRIRDPRELETSSGTMPAILLPPCPYPRSRRQSHSGAMISVPSVSSISRRQATRSPTVARRRQRMLLLALSTDSLIAASRA